MAKSTIKGPIRRIVIFREDAVGDMVIALPAIKAIYDRFDRPQITVVASNYSNNGDLIRHLPYIHEVMTSPKITTLLEMFAFSKVLRARQFDLSVHLSARTGTAWASFFAIPNNVGDRAILGLLPIFWRLGSFHPPHDMMSHQVQRNFILIQKLGISPDDAKTTRLSLPPHPNDAVQIDQLFAAHGVDMNRPIICIHLGAAGGKPVLPEKFVEYIHAMSQQRSDLQWLITGASSEEKHFRDRLIASCQQPVIDLVGKTSVRELISLMDRVSMIVGVDTGPAHIAAARQVPHLLLSTTKRILPFKWGPWLNAHWVIRSNDRCELTCHARQCPEWICSDDVSVSEMVFGSSELLAGRGWQSFDDQQQAWLKACLPILIISDQRTSQLATHVSQTLRSWGLKVIHQDINSSTLKYTCNQRDIRIIHNITGKKKIKLWTMAQLLNKTLSHPPLLLHVPPPLESIDALTHYYRYHFAKRVL